jgi:putative ABC transport system permease protein
VKARQNNWIYAASTPAPLLPLVKDSALFADAASVTVADRQDVSFGDKVLSMQGAFTQSAFFGMFGFPLAEGNKGGILDEPGTVVLSAEAAANLFGPEEAMGKIVTLDKFGAFIVKGVLRPVEGKSHLMYDLYLSAASLPALQKAKKVNLDVDSWNTFQRVYTYVSLKPGVSAGAGNVKVGRLSRYVVRTADEDDYAFQLQGLDDIRTGSLQVYNDNGGGVGWAKILTECGIALLILLAGCFNYTNLTIARGISRSKEVGVRKVAGARRYQVFLQYIMESMMVGFVAAVFAYVILGFILKYKPFNDGYEFMPDVKMGLGAYLLFAGFAVFAGLLAGVLPAWILSSFKAVDVLKNIRTKKLFGNLSLQKSLIVFQFSLSLVILVFLSAFFRQFSYLDRVDPGFRSANIVSVSLQGADAELLGPEFLRVRGTEAVSAVSGNFGIGGNGNTAVFLRTKAEPIHMSSYFVDRETVPMMNLHLLAGGNFPAGRAGGNEEYVLINEAAARTLSFKNNGDAIGQFVRVDDSTSTEVQIKGVVKDFYFRGTGNVITPLVLRMKTGTSAFLNVGVVAEGQDVVDGLAAAWKKVYPHKAFVYYWLHEELEARASQTATISLLGFLALITITIGSLGLLGLVIYTIEVRKKEISIRKVIGASVEQLLALVSKGFVRLLLIAGCISLPIGYILSTLFLQNFANRSSFGIFHLLACFGFLLIIGFITIVSQTWKAATEDPAPNLRLE